jgi:phosphatidylglycerol:prolipoprotein diacylglycerol transferase
MIPYLFHIGPLYFNMFGFFVALGLIVFLWQANKDPIAKKYLKPDQLSNIVIFFAMVGLIGSRIADVLQNPTLYPTWYDIIAVWKGGLALGGAVLAIIIVMPLYQTVKNFPVMPVLDLAGTYGALLQAIARLGCFFAGCCHGCPTTVPWAIIYTHPDSRALLHIPLHPSQLYSSCALFIIFLVIRFIARPRLNKPGQIFGLYLILTSLERFINDFLRADHYKEKRIFYDLIGQNQQLALILCGIGIIMLIAASFRQIKIHKQA